MASGPITVYHNPRCSKSRQTVEILSGKGVEFSLFEYLQERPGVDELRRVMAALGIADPRAMMRTKEAEYAANDLADADAERLLAAMAEHPCLIERPIVIQGDRAVIARPPERVEELLD
jgi:arsenate reductase